MSPKVSCVSTLASSWWHSFGSFGRWSLFGGSGSLSVGALRFYIPASLPGCLLAADTMWPGLQYETLAEAFLPHLLCTGQWLALRGCMKPVQLQADWPGVESQLSIQQNSFANLHLTRLPVKTRFLHLHRCLRRD